MKKIYRGTIISLKNLKTATVEIKREGIDPTYKKPIKKKSKVHAHYEDNVNSLEIGDEVLIQNSKPYSSSKRFIILQNLKQE